MENMIMVDNSSFVFGLNVDNGVPIIPFYYDQTDEELIHLQEYLLQLKHSDIRSTNKNAFQY